MSARNPFMKNNSFEISVNALAAGETTFLGHADKEFFAKNENREVLDADLRVSIVAAKQPGYVDFDLDITGGITVPCDRCLAPVNMPVSASAAFRLRLNGSGATLEDSQEEVFLNEGSDVLDLGQEVYDYSLLALPLQRFHNEGECDAAALGYLSEGSPEDSEGSMESPFSNLADLLNKKQ